MKTLEEIKKIINQHEQELEGKFKVEKIGVFGSYVKGEQKKKSDLDVLVEFKEPIGLEFVELAEFLENILKVKIDLVSRGAIKPNRWKYVEKDLTYV